MTQPYSAIAPGTIVALFGTDLATGTELASRVPLPTTLLDTTVTFNGIAAPLFFVSNTQINALVPFELMTGVAQVEVKRGNVSSSDLAIAVAVVSPGIFALNQQGTGAGAILHASDYRLVSESAPAYSGDSVTVFCTGLGPVIEPERPGQRDTLSRPLVDLADIPAEVTYSGLAPNYIGLYQVNVRVPAGVPTGRHPLQLVINRVPSNTVTLAVRQR